MPFSGGSSGGGGGGGAPSGAAGGDLAGSTYPNPTVALLGGAAIAPSATTDTTSATNITSGTLPAARLPAPTTLALGGVKSLAAPAHQFLTGISTLGVPASAQPASADVSGLAASATTDTTVATNITSGTLPAARLPNPSATTLGGVQSLAATTHQFLTSISTSGVPAGAQPAASDVSGLAASATTDTTVATNISSGTLPTGRFPNSTGVDFDFSGSTNSLKRPAGTTAQRPGTPAAGMERYNTTLGTAERYSAASSSWRAHGGTYVIGQSGAPSATSSATETNLAAVKINGGMMGANGLARITTLWSYTNSANSKTVSIRASTTSGDTSVGTQYEAVALTTTAFMRLLTEVRNLNATGSQGGFPAVSASTFNTSTGAEATSSIDTASDWYININGKTNGTETLTLVGYTIEVLPW